MMVKFLRQNLERGPCCQIQVEGATDKDVWAQEAHKQHGWHSVCRCLVKYFFNSITGAINRRYKL